MYEGSFFRLSFYSEQTKFGDFCVWMLVSNVWDKLLLLSFQGSQKLQSSEDFQNRIRDRSPLARQHCLTLTPPPNFFLWRIKMHGVNLSYYFHRQIFWGAKLLKLHIIILCLLIRKNNFKRTGKKQPYLSNFVRLISDTQFTDTDFYKPCICYYSFL